MVNHKQNTILSYAQFLICWFKIKFKHFVVSTSQTPIEQRHDSLPACHHNAKHRLSNRRR